MKCLKPELHFLSRLLNLDMELACEFGVIRDWTLVSIYSPFWRSPAVSFLEKLTFHPLYTIIAATKSFRLYFRFPVEALGEFNQQVVERN